jgi:hypothetical protein
MDPTDVYFDDELPAGEQGAHVTELQTRLQNTGYLPDPSGAWDAPSQQALVAFGADNGVANVPSADLVAQVQAVTGELQAPQWVQKFSNPDAPYGAQANVLQKFSGERYDGNAVWAGKERDTTYYPDQQTAGDEYGVAVQGGRMTIPGEVDANGNPVYMDTTDVTTQAGLAGSKPERMIYTMDAQGEMRLADPHAEQESMPGERFHHSSLAGGAAIAGAGEMKVREGVVEAVSDKSGHYQPDFGMTTQVDQSLQAGGVDTSRVTYELGNFNAGGGATDRDTLVSGTELGAYDRAGMLDEVRKACLDQARANGARSFGVPWDQLQDGMKQRVQGDVDAGAAQLYARYEAMSDRELMAEARLLIEKRHEAQRTVLSEIPKTRGWREDPVGLHQYRFFDGELWTSLVSDNDVQSEDDKYLDMFNRDDSPPAAAPAAAVPGNDAPGNNPAAQPQDAPPQPGGYLPDPPAQQPGGYLPDPQ